MGETYLGYRFILLAFIIGLNALFASAELSLVSARPSRLRELAAAGNVGAQAALNLLARPERLLATVQVGVTLAGLGAGWAGESTVYAGLMSAFRFIDTPAIHAALHAVAFVIAFLVLTFCMVVLGEIVPKNLGIKKAESYAVVVAPVLLVVYRISEPFIFVLERSSAAVSKLLGLGAQEARTAHSVEELKLIASSVRAAGRLSPFEERALHRLLDLGEVAVREIMVPRHDIVSLPADATLDQTLRAFTESMFSRIPVYEHRPEEIAGFVHFKDVMAWWPRLRKAERSNAAPPAFRLRQIIRKHFVVPESKPVAQMVDEFREHREHLAVVVDEFGTIAGLVTLEDVLEQIFGEIEDEHDLRHPRPPQASPVVDLEGTITIRDLESQYGIALPADAGFETLAGFLLSQLGYIPAAGESVEYGGRRFLITRMEQRRIAQVRVEKLHQPRPTEAKT